MGLIIGEEKDIRQYRRVGKNKEQGTGETKEEKKRGRGREGISRMNGRAGGRDNGQEEIGEIQIPGEENIEGGNKGEGGYIILQRTICGREISG